MTHEEKQVEKVVAYEQEKVEKIVKGSRRADGVLWRHRSNVATRRSHMRQSNMAKQFHPIMHNMHKPCCTVDRRREGETKILNHEHVCSLSSLSKLKTTVDTAYTGKTRSRLVCLIFLFDIHASFSRRIFCVVSTLLTQFQPWLRCTEHRI